MSVPLKKIVAALDAELKISDVRDHDRAHNGLQIENSGTVTKIAATVDAHLPVLEQAVAAGADLLLVHHGMLWDSVVPIVGVPYRKISLCVKNNLAIYSSHLPLDLHPRLGNNILLVKALGLKKLKPFGEANGRKIGFAGETSLPLDDLAKRLGKILHGPVITIRGHNRNIRRVGVVTGGAGGMVREAAAAGLDLLITGEGAHDTYGTARELGVSILYGGHYATETFGVRALSKWLSAKFHLPYVFIDHPSGL